ncbi:RluA family pseudouridine synthase [Clostridium beijerinckii]|uniref:RluA family pseudouridine synthase n=1 Tax=Clostridium beijerinckii TaxID=1520 RepID=UPI00098BD4B5|nr:RluA family pseudouridine synthase [Clostridium beijerinckii]MBA8936978.1 23S rRNA pseudouridine955/2504/2580 synthase [Clostridium beijerinckii]NRU40557.1 23S rRNA pseudouridine955/2504/2580 synthase [Clostridium beijerinckii]NSA96168.1 23S rRNA pseudouridine955/2504/2580 synthase [Clostridium beijerinckii]OOM60581.1 ribosomal large subunit pseudouridine synthase C [Clostridium beijerinckii]OOM67925.1 ribosomal large subunit pseudouridine synthase C [Clostridium beijerinckii]
MKIEIGPNEAGQRLDKFLRKLLKDVPLSAIFKALRKKDIRVNGKKQNEKYFLEEGDVVEIKYIQSNKEDKKEKFIKVDPKRIKIAYEDENVVVIEKWPDVLVHSDRNNSEEPTLTDYVLSYLNDKGDYIPENEITFTPAACNRLDRNTSGMVIFGKTFEGLKAINEAIREDEIRKYYYALAKGKIRAGLYEAYILKNPETNTSKIYDTEVKNSKKISMEISIVESNGAYSLLEIHLITGRSHQIRAHLAHLGNPIIGDNKYGDKKLNSFFESKYGLNFQYLYAYKLNFRKINGKLEYLKNKTIALALPPIFKKIKQDVFKFSLR